MSLDAEALLREKKELEQRLADMEKSKADFVPIEELRKVRAEAAENRRKYQELESVVEERNKLVIEHDKTKKALERVIKETAVMSVAMQLGFNDPSDAVRLVGVEGVEIIEDKIDSEKVKAMVEAVVKEKPYLVKAVSSLSLGGGATNTPSTNVPHAKPELTTQAGIDRLKQMAVDLTKQGRVAEATRLYNQAWEAQFGFKRLVEK